MVDETLTRRQPVAGILKKFSLSNTALGVFLGLQLLYNAGMNTSWKRILERIPHIPLSAITYKTEEKSASNSFEMAEGLLPYAPHYEPPNLPSKRIGELKDLTRGAVSAAVQKLNTDGWSNGKFDVLVRVFGSASIEGKLLSNQQLSDLRADQVIGILDSTVREKIKAETERLKKKGMEVDGVQIHVLDSGIGERISRDDREALEMVAKLHGYNLEQLLLNRFNIAEREYVERILKKYRKMEIGITIKAKGKVPKEHPFPSFFLLPIPPFITKRRRYDMEGTISFNLAGIDRAQAEALMDGLTEFANNRIRESILRPWYIRLARSLGLWPTLSFLAEAAESWINSEKGNIRRSDIRCHIDEVEGRLTGQLNIKLTGYAKMMPADVGEKILAPLIHVMNSVFEEAGRRGVRERITDDIHIGGTGRYTLLDNLLVWLPTAGALRERAGWNPLETHPHPTEEFEYRGDPDAFQALARVSVPQRGRRHETMPVAAIVLGTQLEAMNTSPLPINEVLAVERFRGWLGRTRTRMVHTYPRTIPPEHHTDWHVERRLPHHLVSPNDITLDNQRLGVSRHITAERERAPMGRFRQAVRYSVRDHRLEIQNHAQRRQAR